MEEKFDWIPAQPGWRVVMRAKGDPDRHVIGDICWWAVPTGSRVHRKAAEKRGVPVFIFGYGRPWMPDEAYEELGLRVNEILRPEEALR